MELEMQVGEEAGSMMDKLCAAATALEQAAARLANVEMHAAYEVGAERRAEELEAKLRDAEATIASLKAQGGRKTTAATGMLQAKEGVVAESGALDSALTSLSVEQRIAVKAGLMRSGLLG